MPSSSHCWCDLVSFQLQIGQIKCSPAALPGDLSLTHQTPFRCPLFIYNMLPGAETSLFSCPEYCGVGGRRDGVRRRRNENRNKTPHWHSQMCFLVSTKDLNYRVSPAFFSLALGLARNFFWVQLLCLFQIKTPISWMEIWPPAAVAGRRGEQGVLTPHLRGGSRRQPAGV